MMVNGRLGDLATGDLFVMPEWFEGPCIYLGAHSVYSFGDPLYFVLRPDGCIDVFLSPEHVIATLAYFSEARG